MSRITETEDRISEVEDKIFGNKWSREEKRKKESKEMRTTSETSGTMLNVPTVKS